MTDKPEGPMAEMLQSLTQTMADYQRMKKAETVVHLVDRMQAERATHEDMVAAVAHELNDNDDDPPAECPKLLEDDLDVNLIAVGDSGDVLNIHRPVWKEVSVRGMQGVFCIQSGCGFAHFNHPPPAGEKQHIIRVKAGE